MYTCNKMRAFLRYADGAHLIEHLYAVEEKDVTSLSLTPEEHAHEGLFCALYKCRARIHFLDLAFGVHPQHFRFSFIQTLCVLVTRPILPRVVIVRNVSGGVLDIDEEMAHNIASVIGTYARRCESISTKPASGEIVIQLHDMSMSENAQHILTDELMHQHDSGRFVANVGIYRTVKTSVVPELLQRLFVNGPAQGDA